VSDFAAGLAIGFAMGAGGGLWLGFKLWRQTYVSLSDNVRRWRA